MASGSGTETSGVALRLQNVRRAFEDLVVIHDLSIDIASGQINLARRAAT